MVALKAAPMGHNNPPEPTPLEAVTDRINDLYGEAKLWLDGAAVENQDHADGLARLLDEARKAEKAADAARSTEKEPHLAAGRAVDAAYKPVLDSAKRMQAGIKAALAPWLQAQEAAKRERERLAREEADRQAREAAQARREADAANLAMVEAAEAKIAQAKRAEAEAARAEKERGQAKGGARAVSLHTYWEAEVTDFTTAARHYWTTNIEAFREVVARLAAEDVRAGKRTIPGVTVHERSRVQ